MFYSSKVLMTAVMSAVLSVAAHAGMITFDFEDQVPTGVTAGALSTLSMTKSGVTLTITRLSGSNFDLVENTGSQLKPAAFGNVSLSPFSNVNIPGDKFLATVSTQIQSVQIDAGDYSPSDIDTFYIDGYSNANHTGLVGSASVEIPNTLLFGQVSFGSATLSVAGGMNSFSFYSTSNFDLSLFYDNIIKTMDSAPAVPEPTTAVLAVLGAGAFGFVRRRISRSK